jgi:hypothetical protein
MKKSPNEFKITVKGKLAETFRLAANALGITTQEAIEEYVSA